MVTPASRPAVTDSWPDAVTAAVDSTLARTPPSFTLQSIDENVNNYLLSAVFCEDYVEHRIAYSDRSKGVRRAHRRERWATEREPIGRGGFGVVRLQQEKKTRQLRAVKEVPHNSRSASIIDPVRELIAMAALSKDESNFVKLFGWYQDDLHLYIAMEYFELGDLRKCVEEPLPEPDCQTIVFQVAEALNFMHVRNFAHRDLKPSNIFVVQRVPTWWVKVADFGISKRHSESTGLNTSLSGDNHFAAPELMAISDYLTVTNAVDLWSLGCLASWLLMKDMPLSNPRDMTRFAMGRFELPLAKLRQHNLSERAMNFVKDLLKLDPSQRPTAAAALQHMWLEMILSGNVSDGSSLHSMLDAIAHEKSDVSLRPMSTETESACLTPSFEIPSARSERTTNVRREKDQQKWALLNYWSPRTTAASMTDNTVHRFEASQRYHPIPNDGSPLTISNYRKNNQEGDARLPQSSLLIEDSEKDVEAVANTRPSVGVNGTPSAKEKSTDHGPSLTESGEATRSRFKSRSKSFRSGSDQLDQALFQNDFRDSRRYDVRPAKPSTVASKPASKSQVTEQYRTLPDMTQYGIGKDRQTPDKQLKSPKAMGARLPDVSQSQTMKVPSQKIAFRSETQGRDPGDNTDRHKWDATSPAAEAPTRVRRKTRLQNLVDDALEKEAPSTTASMTGIGTSSTNMSKHSFDTLDRQDWPSTGIGDRWNAAAIATHDQQLVQTTPRTLAGDQTGQRERVPGAADNIDNIRSHELRTRPLQSNVDSNVAVSPVLFPHVTASPTTAQQATEFVFQARGQHVAHHSTSKTLLSFHESLAEALKSARAERKFLLVDTQDHSIPSCQVLKQHIWKEASIVEIVQNSFTCCEYRKGDYFKYSYPRLKLGDIRQLTTIVGHSPKRYTGPLVTIIDPGTYRFVRLWVGADPKASQLLVQLETFVRFGFDCMEKFASLLFRAAQHSGQRPELSAQRQFLNELHKLDHGYQLPIILGIDKVGLLERESKYLKTYKLEWYKLTDACIYGFKNIFGTDKQPHLAIMLSNTSLEMPRAGSGPYEFSITSAGHRTTFRAVDGDAMIGWCIDIQRVINKLGGIDRGMRRETEVAPLPKTPRRTADCDCDYNGIDCGEPRCPNQSVMIC